MAMNLREVEDHARARRDLYGALKEMICERLDLEIGADAVGDNQPLFGRGLDLDSVDALELIVGIDARYGVALADDEIEAFGSVAALTERLLDDPEFTGR